MPCSSRSFLFLVFPGAAFYFVNSGKPFMADFMTSQQQYKMHCKIRFTTSLKISGVVMIVQLGMSVYPVSLLQISGKPFRLSSSSSTAELQNKGADHSDFPQPDVVVCHD